MKNDGQPGGLTGPLPAARANVLVGVALAMLAACHDDRALPEPPAPVPPAGLARIVGVDASDWEARTDPPSPPGDLKAEVDGFTSLDACVDARSRLDPLVGEALEAIGYDTFLRDACRILEAAKVQDATRCEAIDASALRERCQATVAEIAGIADLCPWTVAGRPLLGHEAMCLAVASRDARLCAGVEPVAARAGCEGILTHDGTRCASLPSRSDQSVCDRAVQRWRSAIPVGDPPTRPEDMPRGRGRLHIEGAGASAPLEVDLGPEPDIRRGIVVSQQRDGTRFVVGPLTEQGLDFVAPSPHVRASLAVLAFQSSATGAPATGAPAIAASGSAAKNSGEIRIERAELVVPGRAPMATPTAHSTLTVRFSKFDPTRGSPMVFTIDGTLADAADAWRVHAEIATFVRDVVRMTTGVSAPHPPPPLPVAPSDPRSALDGGEMAP
jgi:hypothetical protein